MNSMIISCKWIINLFFVYILAVQFNEANASDYQLIITVSPSEVGKVFKHGTVVEAGEFTHYDVEALAYSGWIFANWSGDLSGTDNPISLILDRDINAVCNFIKKPYMPPITWTLGKIEGDAAKGTDIRCSANKVAWQRVEVEGEWPLLLTSYTPLSRIWIWDGTLIQLVSTDSEYAHAPSLDNEDIAWTSYDNNDYEISLKEGLNPAINIIDNNILDRKPSLHEGMIAYENLYWGEWDIRYWKNSIIQEIVRAGKDINPSLHNGQIAWQGFDGTDYEIFFWDGFQIIQITENETDDVNPSLYDGKIAWENMGNILFYNGGTMVAVTDDNISYSKPSLCAGAIAFEGFDGNDREIFFWDGQRMDPVTKDKIDNLEPALSYSSGQWTLAWRKEQEVWFGTLEITRIYSLQKTDNEFIKVKWRSIEGATYSIYYSDDEYNDLMIWNLAQDNITSSGYFTDWVDDGTGTGVPPADVNHRYYKVVAN